MRQGPAVTEARKTRSVWWPVAILAIVVVAARIVVMRYGGW